jgi:hypothetical protein
MPDISKCENEECPLKEKCYRFTATPSPVLQAYAYFKPDEDGKCEYFWDNKEYKNES